MVIQRVSEGGVRSRVRAADEVSGEIGRGLVVLIGFAAGDRESVESWAADRVVGLRVFEDQAGKMNQDVRSVGGGVVAVPNFTLAADAAKGRRPSFSAAMPPAEAAVRYDRFVAELRRLMGSAEGSQNESPEGADHASGRRPAAARGDAEVVRGGVVSGVFGSEMAVSLVNDGPVTLVIDG